MQKIERDCFSVAKRKSIYIYTTLAFLTLLGAPYIYDISSLRVKETGLQVNVDKTNYMVMSRDKNAGRSHSMKTDNSFFQRVEEFMYLGTKLTNQNSIQKEIKGRLNSGNACYHSVQNLLSSSLLSKYLNNYNFICCFVWV